MFKGVDKANDMRFNEEMCNTSLRNKYNDLGFIKLIVIM